MKHPIFRITSFEKVAPYILKIRFNDETTRTINFLPFLNFGMYKSLADPKIFEQVQLDKEIHTLVWPNGADFDPATLHDWVQN